MGAKKFICATALVMSAFAAPVGGHAENVGELRGMTYGEWSAKWWQWAFRSEFAQFTDGSQNVDCSAGQRGAVWFLAGTLSGEAATRTCSIPAGKVLFFPLVNYGFWNPDASCPGAGDCTVQQKRENANGFFSDQIPGNLGGNIHSYACQLSATVDGVPVQNIGVPIVRTQSPVFPLTGDGVNDPKTISDGYWVAVELANGWHTIKFTGGLCPFDASPQDIEDGTAPIFAANITYKLRIVPSK